MLGTLQTFRTAGCRDYIVKAPLRGIDNISKWIAGDFYEFTVADNAADIPPQGQSKSAPFRQQ